MSESDCLFCKIVRAEIPSFKVYEDDRTFAFLDIRPVNEGHTLVVPKTHTLNIFDVSPEDWSAVTETVRKLSGTIEQALSASGINLMMNNREHAGQIVDHLHVHIIPRFTSDGLMHWPQHSYPAGEGEAAQKKILAAL